LTYELTQPREPALGGRSSLPLALRRMRRRVSRQVAWLTESFFGTPLGRWAHRRLQEQLEVAVEAPELTTQGVRWPTIAFLSDLHAGHYMTGADLSARARLLDSLEPDLVVLGGDLVNVRLEELGHLDEALKILKRAPLGLFAVPGNHDYVEPEDLDPWVRHLEARGVVVLRNRGLRITHGGASFWVCGVDDLTEGRPDVPQALTGRQPGEPTALFSHHPDVFDVAARHGVHLQVSGHTHGGQIRLLGWAPISHSARGYVSGWHAAGDARLYVSRGAGVSLLPVRVDASPEITLLRPRSRS
jgi:predicted MPP superfamily phosphohydrolase